MGGEKWGETMKIGICGVLLALSLVFFSGSLFENKKHGEVAEKLKHAQGSCGPNVREAKTSLWIAERDLNHLRHLGLSTKNKEWLVENLKRNLNKKEIDCYGQPA